MRTAFESNLRRLYLLLARCCAGWFCSIVSRALSCWVRCCGGYEMLFLPCCAWLCWMPNVVSGSIVNRRHRRSSVVVAVVVIVFYIDVRAQWCVKMCTNVCSMRLRSGARAHARDWHEWNTQLRRRSTRTRKTRISSSRTVYNVIHCSPNITYISMLYSHEYGFECPLVRRALAMCDRLFERKQRTHNKVFSCLTKPYRRARACVHNNAHKIPNDPSMSPEW